MSEATERVSMSEDERFPFYEVHHGPSGEPVDVPAATLARWREVMAEFETVQDEMEAVYKEAKAAAARARQIAKAEAEVAAAKAKLDALREAK